MSLELDKASVFSHFKHLQFACRSFEQEGAKGGEDKNSFKMLSVCVEKF